MKIRTFVGLATSLYAGISSALSQCPAEAKDHCGPNPFYVLVASLADTCTRIDPKHAPDYKKQLEKIVAGGVSTYAALDSDPQFSKDLEEAKQKLKLADPKKVYEACTELGTRPL